MKKTVVISLGGSLIIPDKIDKDFLKKFKKLIADFVKKGNRAIIVTGGGGLARVYQEAAKDINPKTTAKDIDWVGIGATKINAELVRTIFGDLAYDRIIEDPTKKIKTTKKIIVGSGFVPGSSSDKIAVMLAKNFKADTVINLSNIKYVYDKDPAKHKDAKPQKELSWKEFVKIVGTKWIPGAHFPFDPVASALARKSKIDLIVMKGNDLPNLDKMLKGERFVGTKVS